MDYNAPWSFPLDGAWRLRGGLERPGPHHPDRVDGYGWPTLPATVPGCAELALVAAGLAADPAVGDGAWRFRGYEGHEWWWEREFDLDFVPACRIDLVCDWLEGLATLWLDGIEIGTSANGLVAHRFALAGGMVPGRHRLAIRFASTVNAGRAFPGAPGEFHVDSWESLPLRLAGHAFGWDILPRLLGTGIPRSLRLEAVAPVRIREVYWATLKVDVATRWARILCDWDLELPAGVDGWRLRAVLIHDGQERVIADRPVFCHHGRTVVDITEATFWWPRGWGAAALCDAVVELIAPDGRIADRHTCRFGIRHIALETAAGDFAFVVNGQRIWTRGTNWVPLDALHARDGQHRDAVLAMLADLDCTMVRMWGGNRYEDDAVFAWCDAHGVMVWQDFALACGIYPQDDAFAAALATEAAAAIRRLRNHPCLALWCGGNETDEAHEWSQLGRDPRRDRPTREILPLAVRTHDPARAYLANSPCFDITPPPEVHLWGPRNDWMAPYYTKCPAAFISETGFHGAPAVPSLAAMQPPHTPLFPLTDARWRPQAVCANPDPAHPSAYRLPLVERQATLLTGVAPPDIDAFVIASQIVQAEANKALLERFRINKGRTWGMLWWNLRDGWPVISDAVVDYFNRRKFAYAVLKRSQAMVLAAVAEAVDGTHRVVVINDGLDAIAGELRVHADAGAGHDLAAWRFAAGANAIAITVGTLPVATTADCWRLDLRLDDGRTFVNHCLVGGRPYGAADLSRWYRALGITADGVDA